MLSSISAMFNQLPFFGRIDSSGMGELISAYTSVTNRGGKLKLLNLPTSIQDVLGITQLITVFDVFDDEEEALASFS